MSTRFWSQEEKRIRRFIVYDAWERPTIYEHQPWKDPPCDTSRCPPTFPLYRSTSLAGERPSMIFAFHAFAFGELG